MWLCLQCDFGDIHLKPSRCHGILYPVTRFFYSERKQYQCLVRAVLAAGLTQLRPLIYAGMGLLPDTQNCGLRMRRECRERFPRLWFHRKLLVNDPGMHHGTCVTHVPWCMSGSLTCGGGENVPGIPGACATRNFTFLSRGPWRWSRSFIGSYCLDTIVA